LTGGTCRPYTIHALLIEENMFYLALQLAKIALLCGAAYAFTYATMLF
jgi:hypothetical protein